ncbi:hypothetical protein OS493_009407 [Desmophyllum pertusum]|uniref:Uncharacterized protein n=1 Tax=Desmophyllum pertusum TaxID=174260 RepID=A0A9W9Z308_9CNID|nr:hypothetical protein OS493_009407 [Desmophyllum pertusum]
MDVSGAYASNVVDTDEDRSNPEPIFQMPISSVTEDFSIGNNDRLDNIELPKMEDTSAYNSDVTLDRAESTVGNLISLDDDDDDQIPIQNEFSIGDGFLFVL